MDERGADQSTQLGRMVVAEPDASKPVSAVQGGYPAAPVQYAPGQYPPAQYPPGQYQAAPYQPAPPGIVQGQPIAYANPQAALQQAHAAYQHAMQVVGSVPGKDILGGLNSVMIKQRPQYLETFTDCEFENRYTIHNYEGEQKGPKLLKCRERSTCISRHCVGPECRPFSVFVTKKKHMGKGALLRFDRDYAYTCCCCNRPYLLVYDIEESMKGVDSKELVPSDKDVLIGRVHDPFNCCDMTFNSFNAAGEKDYFIRGSCCQCGLCCHCPCGPCKRVTFTIFDRNQQEVGSLEKIWYSCAREAFSNADTYIANFPAAATWQQKAVLLAAVIMIDFRHFEQKKKQNH